MRAHIGSFVNVSGEQQLLFAFHTVIRGLNTVRYQKNSAARDIGRAPDRQ